MKSRTTKSQTNRKNAAKSTGPTTKNGKKTVALNGISHGLRSLKPVIPWLESEEDWILHRDRIMTELHPTDALECALSERIALGLWRLARSVETQSRILEATRERARSRAIRNSLRSEGLAHYCEPKKSTFSDMRSDFENLSALVTLWEEILTGPDNTLPDPDLADELINSICIPSEWSSLRDSFYDSFDWPPKTKTDLRRMVDWLIKKQGKGIGASIEDYAEIVFVKAREESALITRISEEGERAADLALVESDVMEKLQRYETSIHRTLLKDLQEFERLQKSRSGGGPSTPITIDLGSSS